MSARSRTARALRRQPDRDPLESYLAGEILPCPAAIEPSPTWASAVAALGRRSLRTARAGALPVLLAGALSLFGLVRMQPANTLWSQELTLTSSIETGEFSCEPITFAFIGLEHPADGTTKLTYALSGGGTNGPGCQDKDISNLSIGVCFDTKLDPDGPVVSETHPGAGNTAWKYDGKNSGTPRLIKWDSKTESAPLGGRGPFDPDEMRFSYTINATLQLADLVDGAAKFKAGPTETAAGTVKVPACPLPVAPGAAQSFAAPLAEDEPQVEEVPAVETVLPQVPDGPINPVEAPLEPEEDKPTTAGPVGIAAPPSPRPQPTPTPKPVGVSIGRPR